MKESTVTESPIAARLKRATDSAAPAQSPDQPRLAEAVTQLPCGTSSIATAGLEAAVSDFREPLKNRPRAKCQAGSSAVLGESMWCAKKRGAWPHF